MRHYASLDRSEGTRRWALTQFADQQLGRAELLLRCAAASDDAGDVLLLRAKAGLLELEARWAMRGV